MKTLSLKIKSNDYLEPSDNIDCKIRPKNMDEIMSPARRLSGENWRIFESWKKERDNLKEFQEQYVMPRTEADDEEGHGMTLYDMHDSDSMISCGHTACHHLTLCDDESVSKYESCLDTARSSLPVIRQEEEEEIQRDEEAFQVNGIDYHRETSLMRHWFGQRNKFAEEMPEKEGESNNILKNDGTTPVSNEFQEQGFGSDEMNSKWTAAVCCLLAIEPFQKYFRGIIYHEANGENGDYQQRDTTLEYVIKVFRKTRRLQENEMLEEILRLVSEFSLELPIAETCFETLKGMLGKLHEEIILAKNLGNLKRTCLRKCRQSNRSNHSIISHLFRGHLKRRDLCPCGYQNISHDPFTSIPLFSSALDEKTLVIPVNSRAKDKRLTTVRYLIRLNQHTRIDDIKGKLSHIDKYNQSDLVIASVKNNDVRMVHSPTSTVFDAMCEAGELQAFVICRGPPEQTRQGGKEEGDSYPFTSTPAPTDCVDAEEEERGPAKENVNAKKSEIVTIPVVFKDDSFERCDKKQVPPVFVQIRKTMQGNCAAKILKFVLGSTETECRKMFVTVLKMKDNTCAVCKEQNCSGCHVTPNRAISLDKSCKIVAFIPPAMKLQKPESREHDSFAKGIPSNVYTIAEGVAAFRNGENTITCNRCGIERSMDSTKTVISYPDFLVLTNDSNAGANEELVIPSVDFSPALSKANKNRKRYDLSGLITSTEGSNNKKDVIYHTAAKHAHEKNKTKQRIEILIYVNNQCDERKKIKTAVTAMSKKRKVKQPMNNGRVDEVYPKMKENSLENSEEDGDCNKDKEKDDETVSACNCSQCHCWQQCSEQIRRNSFTGFDKLKKEEEKHVPKENNSPVPSLTVQLQRALFKQDLRRIVSVLKKGANPNNLVDGSAAIHFAAGLANPAGYLFTKLLIDYGADVTLKSAAGQTPIQFAAIFGRSETIRLLSYHGADLAEIDKVGDLRSAKRIASFLRGGSEALSTPQDSPVSKRYFEEHCNDDDPYLRTMVQLKKSLALDHEVLDGPKCHVENMEGLREVTVKAVAEKLFPKHKETIVEPENTEEKTLETQSLVPLEITGDIAMSDLCEGEGVKSSIGVNEDDTIMEQEVDEVDGNKTTESDQEPLSSAGIASNESLSHVQAIANVAFDSSAVEEDVNSIQYAPKTFMRPAENRWTKYLCCSSKASSRKSEKDSRRSRGWLRIMLGRISQWFRISSS